MHVRKECLFASIKHDSQVLFTFAKCLVTVLHYNELYHDHEFAQPC